MAKISIIILNYNDYQETENCVECLLKYQIKEKIIIVDNNSSNDSFNILKGKFEKYSNIDIIQSPQNNGYSSGNNIGINFSIKKYPEIEYFAIMNPDVRIMYHDIFDNIINKLKKHDEIAAMSPIMIFNGKLNYTGMCWDLPTEKTIFFNHILFLKNKDRKKDIYIENDLIARVDVIPGSFFIIKRKELEKIDLLDENVFLYNEENILSLKLKKIGKFEALSMNDYYLHNHKQKKKKKTIKEWLKLNEVGFKSRRYLCEIFYSKKALKHLKFANRLNIIYIYAKRNC